MAVDGFGSKVFGLREVKIVSADGLTVVSLPAAQELQVTIETKTNELRGNDSVISTATFVDKVSWKISNGGIPLSALAIMTGKTVTVAGTSPNANNTIGFNAGDSMPYFKIYGKMLDDSLGDLHCKIFRAKITDNIDGTFQDNDFYVASISGSGINDGSGKMIEFKQNETAAALPTS